MKKKFAVLGTVALLLSCKNEIPKPIMVLETETVLLDTLTVNTETEHNILIRNEGNANLEIQKIESSCGCTIGKINDSILKPNTSTQFSFLVTPEYTGDFSKNMVIRSNDEKVFHIIKIKGFVIEK